MKKILLLLCLCLFIEEIASRELDKTFQLLPQPQSIELTSGKGINYWELSYILSSDTTSIPILGDYAQQTSPLPTKRETHPAPTHQPACSCFSGRIHDGN